MAIIVIPLKDFIVDPHQNIDLLSLTESEAVALIRKSFDFLSSSMDVSIKQGIATIELREAKAQQVQEALTWFKQGVKHAQTGQYRKAIQVFKRVLERLPAHVEARRNMAMAFLESGDKEEAKNHLIEVLRLNPRDVWSYVLLGNIYAKYQNDFESGEKFYRKAFELDPEDAILLTNYGALWLERGAVDQAEEFFKRGIRANPKYPNSYYALALLYINQGKTELTIGSLDELFAKSRPADIRGLPLYDEARKLYLEANRQVAEKSYDAMMEFLDAKKSVLAERMGIPILIVEDNSLEYVYAVAQSAWRHERDRHVIKYRSKHRTMIPHILTHELEHIILEYDARQAARNRSFATPPNTREYAIRSVGDHVEKLQRAGYKEDEV